MHLTVRIPARTKLKMELPRVRNNLFSVDLLEYCQFICRIQHLFLLCSQQRTCVSSLALQIFQLLGE